MELAKAYDPKLVEDRRYQQWLDSSIFTGKAEGGRDNAYCITIPPPNITGSLHMGHALNNTVIDTLTRWHRMRGFNAITVPGTDHAGIATQNVVERSLAKDGISRHDLGRDKFIEKCWEWRKEYGDRIYLQFQKLGCAYDWSRKRFTMDETYVEAIHEEFLRWWDRGLIYRGARVVNWCPRCRSAISDIEVTSEDRAGKLWHFKYPIAETDGEFIVIATTRPETLLGDSAVAVNPADPRYMAIVGKMVNLPLANRQIPIVADQHAKIEFGTGALKITPAHDLDDFEVGLRHNLPQYVVIAEDGRMNDLAGPNYADLDRFDARAKVVADMEALGLLDKIEDYGIKTPLCDRCKTVLEPLLSEQWFVDMKPLAAPAIEAVTSGRIEIVPERYNRIYLDWMENIRDWCISRQLWWGHRIPVWWTTDGKYVAARSLEDAAERLGVPAATLRQDEDVLDTWFSSALWPHAVLGWPKETADLKTWYPTDLLSTAQEILYLWVARMIMTGLDFVGDIPFKQVYIHPTVLDEKGERMSKSKGNGVDPLDLIEAYGADALRFYLLQRTGMNQDVKFREEEVKLAGQFCNKLWNASRFVLMNLQELDATQGAIRFEDITTNHEALATSDRWILSRLQQTITEVNSKLATFDFDHAMRAIYTFLWDDFCDWYVELAKPRLRLEGEPLQMARCVLEIVLTTTLRLMHPMIPFITEEIMEAFATRNGGTIPGPMMAANYPVADEKWICAESEMEMAQVIDCIRAFRNLRAEAKLPAGQKLTAAIAVTGPLADNLAANRESILGLARLSALTIGEASPVGSGTWTSAAIEGAEIFVEIGGALDVPKELERIAKELLGVEKDLEASTVKLANAQFTDRAPAAIVQKERDYNASLDEMRRKLVERQKMLATA